MNAVCCSVEEFEALAKKPCVNIPRVLLKAVITLLPSYALEVYLILYDLSKLNIQYPGIVVISHGDLAKELGKSVSSIRRSIHRLKIEGYIDLKERNESYLPNSIRIGCPKAIVNQLLERFTQ